MNMIEIMRKVNDVTGIYQYGSWYIGTTADPDAEKIRHAKPTKWNVWEAENLDQADIIEKHFRSHGMDGEGEPGNGIHVFIYRK